MPSLGTLVNQQAPPPNPQTPATRTNPEHEWFTALQCVRATTEEARDKGDQQPPEVHAILDGIRIACSRLLAGVDPKAVAASMASMVALPIAPMQSAQLQQLAATLTAPPIAPGGGGAPGSPFGAAHPGAPALSMPHMPVPPVGGLAGAGATAGPAPAGPVSPPVGGG